VTTRTKLLGAALFTLAGVLFASGCGEQDLYKPPTSDFSVRGRATMPSDALDVDVLGSTAFVAAGQGGLRAFDISNPANPIPLWAINTGRETRYLRVERTFLPDGSFMDIAFVTQGTEGIHTFDATPGVPDSLRMISTAGTTAISANDLCVVLPEYHTDPYIVYLADTWKGIRVHFADESVPGIIRYRSFVPAYGVTRALDVVDGIAFVADDQMGVTVINVRTVTVDGMFVIDNLDTPGNAWGIDVADGYAFVADRKAGVHVMSIDDQYRLERVATVPVSGDCVDIQVGNGYAFVAARDAGLHVIDVRDPERPRLAGTVVSSSAEGVALGEGNIVCVADAVEGLLVLSGPDLPIDNTPPQRIQDLAARLESVHGLVLSWTAPGDDGFVGRAEDYDIRQAEWPITAENWEAATRLIRRPRPKEAGTIQTLSVGNLEADSTYYFAIRSRDEAYNLSEISNVAVAVMTTPALTQGGVTPEIGDAATEFTYSVMYSDPEGDAPALATVRIDGQPFDMSPAEGDEPDYTAGVLFEYRTTLMADVHTYQFAFDDGHGPVVTTLIHDGPEMPIDPFEFEMIPIDVGAGAVFSMGSPASESGRDSDELSRDVTLTRSFAISAIEVTQSLYVTIMESNPSFFPGFSRPVESVTWFDAVAFCNAYSEHDGLTPAYEISGEVYNSEGHLIAASVNWDRAADGYRLPTEAEWEYACRAGSAEALANGPLTEMRCDLDPNLDAMGWYCGNSEAAGTARSQGVATKAPNAYGLYDMHGNVWEWCWDLYDLYADGPQIDPEGPSDGTAADPRVRRGGSWFYFARDCRSASRDSYYPGSADNTIGMRIVRTLAGK